MVQDLFGVPRSPHCHVGFRDIEFEGFSFNPKTINPLNLHAVVLSPSHHVQDYWVNGTGTSPRT